MRDFFKRYRELIVIGALLAITIVVWVANGKKGRDLNTVDRWVLTVTQPIERTMNTLVFSVIDAFHGFSDLRQVRLKNEELLQRIFHLEGQLAALGEIQAENERFQDMIGMAPLEEISLVAVRIVGEGMSKNTLTVTIDKGSAHNIVPNMAVITRHGIVGRTAAVASNATSVVLLADPQATLPVRVQRSRARAVVRGMGSGQNFAVERLERTGDVMEGDLIVTSGTDGVFPKGLPVGRVVELNRPDHGMFLAAKVDPFVNLTSPDSTLEEVFVVTGFHGQGAFNSADNASVLPVTPADHPSAPPTVGTQP